MPTDEHFDVFFSQGAENDIEAIHEYIAVNGSLEAADRLIEALYDRIDRLERFPFRGSTPREIEGESAMDVRQIVAGNYRLFYQVIDNQVLVILIVDGRRDLQTLLRSRILTPPDLPR